jgi:hypothetical protein
MITVNLGTGVVATADHEARDVLKEHERDPPLAAQLDEVRALEARRAEQDSVVRDDPDGEALDVGEAADERLAVPCLELVQLRSIDQPRDHLAHVVRLTGVRRDHAVQLVRAHHRVGRLGDVPRR